MCNEFIERVKNGECTSFELALSAICLILFGVLIGMIIAPVRLGVYGSFNGNSGSLTVPENAKDLLKKKDGEEKES